MMQWPGIDANRTVAASLAKARRMASACVALALLAPAVTRAAELGECGELNRIENLVDPVKSYADGRIRLAHVSTGGEPVCCSSHLLVLIDAEDRSQCFAVSEAAATKDAGPSGYSVVDLTKVSSGYDPKLGRLLSVRYYEYDGGKRTKPRIVRIRVNLSGEGSVRLEP